MDTKTNKPQAKQPLNKPMKSTKAGKKMMVYVLIDGKKKLIHFGQAGAPDFASGSATKEQRKSYLARSGGIRNKKGQLTKNLKSSPNYWSRRILWNA